MDFVIFAGKTEESMASGMASFITADTIIHKDPQLEDPE